MHPVRLGLPEARTSGTPRSVASGVLDTDANICSMQEYRYTVAEHDRDRPWIVVASKHQTVKLEDGANSLRVGP
jgi:hypothetical protein